MAVFIIKRFTGGILNTNAPGFIRGRKYDQDLGRLGKMETSQRELHKPGQVRQEMRKMGKELNEARKGKWLQSELKDSPGL